MAESAAWCTRTIAETMSNDKEVRAPGKVREAGEGEETGDNERWYRAVRLDEERASYERSLAGTPGRQ